MALPPSPSLLLLLPLFLVPVGAPCPSPDQPCTAADIAIAEGNAVVSTIQTETETDKIWSKIDLLPNPDFDGVTLSVYGSQGRTSVWFPISTKCFSNMTWWWEMQVGAFLRNHNSPFDLTFMARVEGCSIMSCSLQTLENTLQKLELTAHGPSSWRKTLLNFSCPIVRLASEVKFNVEACKPPPGMISPTFCPKTIADQKPSAPSGPSNKLLVYVGVVIVVAVVVVVVTGLVVTVKIRRLVASQTTAAHVTISHPEAPRHPPPAVPRRPFPAAPRSGPPRNQPPGEASDTEPIYDSLSGLYVEVI